MKNLLAYNLADLQRRSFDGAAAKAVQWFDEVKSDKRFLAHTLRSHETEPIDSREEVAQRNAVDHLLIHVSKLEIASTVGYVRVAHDVEPFLSIWQMLQDRAVCQFYEMHYPLLLPQLFRRRFDGTWAGQVDDEKGIPLFLELLTLTEAMERNNSLRLFLRVLDDYAVDYNNDTATLGKFLSRFENPIAFFDAIGKPVAHASATEVAVQGFSQFLTFGTDLYWLLERAGDLPLLQSAMWHLHGYWFGHLRDKAAKAVDRAIEHFHSWRPMLDEEATTHADPKFADETEASIEELRRVMREMFSDRFSKALKAAAMPALNASA